MAYIGNQPTIGQYRKLDDISGSFNGSLTAFTMQVGSTNVSAGSVFQLLISLGGVIQNPGTDFTVSGSTLTFTTAPTSGLDFFGILMGQPLNTATPGDSTVTGAKIVDGTITGAKLAAGFNYDSGLLFLDDTNNRVGIGLTSPESPLHVESGSETIVTIEGNNTSAAAGGVLVLKNNDTSANNLNQIQGADAGGQTCSAISFVNVDQANNEGELRFLTRPSGGSPTEVLRLTSNGTLQLRNSPGIDFSQIQTNVAGMTSETLDSYEEGTWTPVFADNSGGEATMTVQQGFYTKIGNIVNVWFQIAWSDKGTLGASAVAYFSGFPFSAKSNSSQYYYLGATIKNATTDGVIALAGNGTIAVSQPLNGPSSNQTPSDFSSSGRMMCSMTYFT